MGKEEFCGRKIVVPILVISLVVNAFFVYNVIVTEKNIESTSESTSKSLARIHTPAHLEKPLIQGNEEKKDVENVKVDVSGENVDSGESGENVDSGESGESAIVAEEKPAEEKEASKSMAPVAAKPPSKSASTSKIPPSKSQSVPSKSASATRKVPSKSKAVTVETPKANVNEEKTVESQRSDGGEFGVRPLFPADGKFPAEETDMYSVTVHMTDALQSFFTRVESYRPTTANISLSLSRTSANGVRTTSTSTTRATLTLWGIGSLSIRNSQRRSFHIQLPADSDVVFFDRDVKGRPAQVRSIIALSMFEDSHRTKYRSMVRILTRMGLFMSRTSYGVMSYSYGGEKGTVSQGLYLLMQHPYESVHMAYGGVPGSPTTPVGGIAQRLHPYPQYRNRLAELPSYRHGGATDTLYAKLFETVKLSGESNSKSNSGSNSESNSVPLAATVKGVKSLQWDEYLRWIGVNSMVKNRDYVDEALFYFLKNESDTSNFKLRIMPWDYTSILENCQGRNPNDPLMYCVRSPLEEIILAHWRHVYARRLYELLVYETSDSDFANAFQWSVEEIRMYCDGECEELMKATYAGYKTQLTTLSDIETATKRFISEIFTQRKKLIETLETQFSCKSIDITTTLDDAIKSSTVCPEGMGVAGVFIARKDGSGGVVGGVAEIERERERDGDSVAGVRVECAAAAGGEREREKERERWMYTAAGERASEWCLRRFGEKGGDGETEKPGTVEKKETEDIGNEWISWWKSQTNMEDANYVLLRDPIVSSEGRSIRLYVLVKDYTHDCPRLIGDTVRCGETATSTLPLITVALPKGTRLGISITTLGNSHTDLCWQSKVLKNRRKMDVFGGLYGIGEEIDAVFMGVYLGVMYKDSQVNFDALKDFATTHKLFNDSPQISAEISSMEFLLPKLREFMQKNSYSCTISSGVTLSGYERERERLCEGLPASPQCEGEDDKTSGERENGEGESESERERDWTPRNSFDSLQEMFLHWKNGGIEYVILRNYETLSEEVLNEAHPDIDLLIDDYVHTCPKMTGNSCGENKSPISAGKYVKVAKKLVKLDFRYVGDDYYSADWERHMLSTRLSLSLSPSLSLSTLSPVNYYYSLLYHGLLHKPTLGNDYVKKLNHMIQLESGSELPELRERDMEQWKTVLGTYLDKMGYKCPTPIDRGVAWQRKRVADDQRLIYTPSPDAQVEPKTETASKSFEAGITLPELQSEKCERHLTIIWENGKLEIAHILGDLEKEGLHIDAVVNTSWPSTCIFDNYVALYGKTHAKVVKPKIARCGSGNFQAIFLQDCSPTHVRRATSDPKDPYKMITRSVNQRLFDLKQRYREWIGKSLNRSKIDCFHSTVSDDESEHDVPLLLHAFTGARQVNREYIEGERWWEAQGVCLGEEWQE